MIATHESAPLREWCDMPLAYSPMPHATSTPTVIIAAPMNSPRMSLLMAGEPRKPTEEKGLPSLSRTHRNNSSRVPPKTKNSLTWNNVSPWLGPPSTADPTRSPSPEPAMITTAATTQAIHQRVGAFGLPGYLDQR